MVYKRPSFIVTLLILVLSGYLVVNAQTDEQPAPEYLYRDGNHLVLVNGYTGEKLELPFEVTERDRFVWSPDGQYLLAHVYTEDSENYCLSLYDVDQQAWVDDEPFACATYFTTFSDDGLSIYYTTSDKTNAKLWVYSLADKSNRQLYATTSGSGTNPSGISELIWSPTRQYLTFVSYKQILGGTLNFFVMLNIQTGKNTSVSAPDPYYASYRPVWSADDQWFLISLAQQYVISGTQPFSNYENDVYLANTATGELHRLTYTPTIIKHDIHWTDDGQIAYSEIRVQPISYTIEQAMDIEVIPRDQIVTPEPINTEENRYDPSDHFDLSPDPYIAATTIERTVEETHVFELRILNWNPRDGSVDFTIPIENPTLGTVLIGWRPSSYRYSYG